MHQDVKVSSAGSATIDTAVTLDNRAPAGQPPSYQLGPDDKTSFISGQYVANVYLWGPRGSTQFGSLAESGLRSAKPPSRSCPTPGHRPLHHHNPGAVTVGRLSLTYIPQPRLDPITFTADVSAPDWAVEGPRKRTWSLTRTTTVTWQLSP